MDGEFKEYSASLGTIKTARLILTSTVRGVRLMTCESKGDLYQVRYRGVQPVFRLEDSTLTVQTNALRMLEDNPSGDSPLRICLNSSVSWEIEFRGGAKNVQADLRSIRLHALDILGDSQQMELYLPRPAGASFLYVSGNMRDTAIYRPCGVGMRLNVIGGIEKCSFDHQMIHAVRAETSLDSKDFSPKGAYYHLTVTGSAKSVTLVESANQEAGEQE